MGFEAFGLGQFLLATCLPLAQFVTFLADKLALLLLLVVGFGFKCAVYVRGLLSLFYIHRSTCQPPFFGFVLLFMVCAFGRGAAPAFIVAPLLTSFLGPGFVFLPVLFFVGCLVMMV